MTHNCSLFWETFKIKISLCGQNIQFPHVTYSNLVLERANHVHYDCGYDYDYDYDILLDVCYEHVILWGICTEVSNSILAVRKQYYIDYH
jgi:hypothetical protein